jgi:glycosyltransferase involved in cell wall biosynthesis
MVLLVKAAGPKATHVLLCDDMRDRFVELYGRSLKVVVVSNATNVAVPSGAASPRARLKTIGFISNLTRHKGVLEFLDLAELICRECPDLRALLAGPVKDASLARLINERLQLSPSITYLGPVYGEEKSRFYSRVDVFVFPTRYGNEAEPRVINEALAHGVAVIARNRGCIRSVIDGRGGVAISDDEPFLHQAERVLLEWYHDPDVFSSISAAALATSARMRADSDQPLRKLISDMTGIR